MTEQSKKPRMGKKKKKQVLRAGAGAVAVILAVLCYFRFLYVPKAPAAGEGNAFVSENLSCAFLGNGCTVAVLPLCVTDPLKDAQALTAHARRFDVAVLPSADELSVQCADRFLSAASVRTLLVPRGLSAGERKALAEAHPGVQIVKMPYRKAVTAGEFMFYDLGSAKSMSLVLTHGTERVAFFAHPSGGTYDAAFLSKDAVSSGLTAPLAYLANDADETALKAKTVGFKRISGTLSFIADGEGAFAALSFDDLPR